MASRALVANNGFASGAGRKSDCMKRNIGSRTWFRQVRSS